jgi:hypothetical protein
MSISGNMTFGLDRQGALHFAPETDSYVETTIVTEAPEELGVLRDESKKISEMDGGLVSFLCLAYFTIKCMRYRNAQGMLSQASHSFVGPITVALGQGESIDAQDPRAIR